MSEAPENDKPAETEDATDEMILDKELDDLAGGVSCVGHVCQMYTSKPIIE